MNSLKKRNDLSNLLRLLSILIIILLILSSFLWSLEIEYSSPLIVFSFIFNTIISIIFLSLSLSEDGISLRVMFFFFNSLFLCMVPLAQYVLNRWMFLTSDSRNIFYANILITFASIFFLFGYRWARKNAIRSFKKYVNSTSTFSRKVEGYEFSSKGFVLMLLLVGVFAAFVIYRSGFSSLLLRSGSGVTNAVGGWGPVGLISQYFGRPLPLILLLFSFYKIRFNRTNKFLDYTFLAASLCLTILLNFPLATARFYAFTVYLAITITLVRPNKNKSYLYLIILFAGLFGSSVLETFRHVNSLADASLSLAFDPESFFVGHYDAYENFIHSINYVEMNGNTWGRQLLGAILFWVPRSMWPDKPISTGAYVAQEHLKAFFTVHNTNLSSPYIEELYVDFNILAVIIGCFLIGCLFGYLDYLYKRMIGDPSTQTKFSVQPKPMYFVLYPILIGLSFLWLRGAAMSAFAYTSGIVTAYGLSRFVLIKPHIHLR
mgnify:CR=1 FL=1